MKTDLQTVKNTVNSRAFELSKWLYETNPVEKTKYWLWVLVRTVLIFGICFIILYPVLLKISIAFKDPVDIFDSSVVWIPRHFTLDNIKLMIDRLDYWKAITATFTLSAGASILQLISCALAGYGFARLPFRGSAILFMLVIFTIVIPPQTIMAPTYLHFRFFDVFGIYHLFTGKPGFNLLESYWPTFISAALGMGMKNGLYIFIFRQFFRGLPKELEEASYVDGAGVLKTFAKVMLPNSIPAISTVLLFSFVWQWNDDYFVNIFMANSVSLSRQLGMLTSLARPEYVGGFAYSSMLINTGALLGIAPIFLLYLYAQRYFVESVERAGLVG
ncbi:carbohydrate ABC transporter permease [Cohnella yongneupensis]|uniref:Carbohydrate ABC transporter permease n=1 Tax=Cohnella yongneupensis TaxID=425006 RepID=A0ABW0QSY7_9BACL